MYRRQEDLLPSWTCKSPLNPFWMLLLLLLLEAVEVEVPLTIVKTFSHGCAGCALDEGVQLVWGVGMGRIG